MGRENNKLVKEGKFRYWGSNEIGHYGIYEIRINGEHWYEVYINEGYDTESDTLLEAMDRVKEIGEVIS